jgi:uncharacterized membrane protein
MTAPKWLTVIGAVFIFVGITLSFTSYRNASKAMGEAQKGFAPLAPDGYGPGSPEWNAKTELTDNADLQLYGGLALSALGLVLQTLGSILPLSNRRQSSRGRDP